MTNLELKREELLKKDFYVGNIKPTENGFYMMFEARDNNGVDYELIENTKGEIEAYAGLKRVYL